MSWDLLFLRDLGSFTVCLSVFSDTLTNQLLVSIIPKLIEEQLRFTFYVS